MPSGNSTGSYNNTNKKPTVGQSVVQNPDSPSVAVQPGNSDVTNANGVVSNAEIAADPYGKNTPGGSGLTASFRQRGEATQKRVGLDTRVRGDKNSGTDGAAGSSVGKMKDAMGPTQDAQATPAQQIMQQGVPQNASWEATRPAVDLNTVRNNLLNMVKKPSAGM